MKNVGLIDRVLRFVLGLGLVYSGLFLLNGIHGNIIGIIISVCSLLPFYMAFTATCFVFRWFKIHSLSKKECEIYGQPYPESKE
jgi:hypothetical protein